MTTAQIIQYYKALLILQYRALGNALAEIELWVTEFLQNQIVAQVRDAFDVTTAIGAQLDILGQYRGISRTLFGVAAGAYWSLCPYGTNPATLFGWALYAGPTPTVRWLQYADLDSVPYTLTDIQMRTLIQLKAAFDSWDGTLGSLDNILYSYFGVYVNVVDGGNMTMIFQHQSVDPDPNKIWALANVAGIFPHNAGVSFTVEEV